MGVSIQKSSGVRRQNARNICYFPGYYSFILCTCKKQNGKLSLFKWKNSRAAYTRYSMISSIHGACYIENGTLDLSGTVTARAKTDYAKVTLTLQAHIGGKWKNQGSWSATGTTTATKMKEIPAERDVLYRLKITGYVSNSETGEEESTTIYSDVVSY